MGSYNLTSYPHDPSLITALKEQQGTEPLVEDVEALIRNILAHNRKIEELPPSQLLYNWPMIDMILDGFVKEPKMETFSQLSPYLEVPSYGGDPEAAKQSRKYLREEERAWQNYFERKEEEGTAKSST